MGFAVIFGVDGHVHHGVFLLGRVEELGFVIDAFKAGSQVTLDSGVILRKDHQADHIRPALGKGHFNQHFHHSLT